MCECVPCPRFSSSSISFSCTLLEPISVTPPNFVELQVTETDPGLKGDTAQGGTKPATLSTGATIKVPLFVNVGDVLRVDTRKGEYVSRA